MEAAGHGRPAQNTLEHQMSSHGATRPAPRDRGLGYALMGALVITLAAILIGGALFTWLLVAAGGPAAADLLPADTQLYAATTPNVGGVVEVEQLQNALRQGFGVADPGALLAPVEGLLGVSLRDHVVTWLGSEIVVAARSADPAALQGTDPAEALLREGEVLFLFASKNDPQAAAFLAKHAEARRDGGATVAERDLGDEVTLYSVEGGPPSPIAAFALVDHYVVFSNSPTAIEVLAGADEASPARLGAAPAFQSYKEQINPGGSVSVYTDGTPGAERVRAALRDILGELAE
jgi:hypothetical protein